MWFASIWVYTLELPWELGADFFYRHLLDGDPASNTCSWRWVCGLHTAGKTYLARAANIEKFTQSKFNPEGKLALNAAPLNQPSLPDPIAPNFMTHNLSGLRYGLLMTEEDISIDTLALCEPPTALMGLGSVSQRSVLPLSVAVADFAPALVKDGAIQAESAYQLVCPVYDGKDWEAVLKDWVREYSLDSIVTPRVMVGPVRTRLQRAAARLSIPFLEIARPYDRTVTQYAENGFFRLKKKIPNILIELNIPFS